MSRVWAGGFVGRRREEEGNVRRKKRGGREGGTEY